MGSSGPNAGSQEKPARRRSKWERGLVWGGIAALLALVAFEWNSRRQYDATLSSLESAIAAARDAGESPGIPASDVEGHIQGSPIRSEDAGRSSDGGNGSKPSRRRLVYRWRSLFKTYKLEVSISGDGRAIAVESAADADAQAPDKPLPLAKRPRGLPAFGLSQADKGVVDLAADEFSADLRSIGCGSLGRELFRQALLIAARDELGLTTRDVSIGEIPFVIDSPQAFPLQLNVRVEFDPGPPEESKLRVYLSRAEPSGKEFLWTSSPIVVGETQGMLALAGKMEAFSRGEFLTALQEAGYEKSAAASVQPVPALEEFEGQLDFVSQFAVLRQLHSQRRATGETAENLGDLVRAYANLGNLIEFHWSPASKAFKARALLYAQRLLTKFGASKSALAHRAYALALIGHHAMAIAAAKEARSAAGEALPEWLPIIEAYCEYRSDPLDAAKGPLKEFAIYLKMRMADPGYDRKNCIEAIGQFARLNPACCYVPELMCEVNELGMVRAATEEVVDAMWPRIHERLADVPGLPDKALKISSAQSGRDDPPEEHRDRVHLMSHLRQAASVAPDGIEPAWSALAEMIGDATLVQCWRVVHAEQYWLGISADQSIAALSPLVKGHHYEKCLECCSSDRAVVAAALNSLAQMPEHTTAELPLANFAMYTYGIAQDFFMRVHGQHLKNWDPIFHDLFLIRNTNSPDLKDASTAALLEVSPDQPRAIVVAIETNWENVSKHSEEWERKYATNAPALAALGIKYRETARSDDAIRCLQKSLDVAPAHYVYWALAHEYHDRDDLEACQQTWERATKLPSTGLEQSEAHRSLAHLLMNEGKWKEAEPHVRVVASTYSAGGLSIAAEWAEGMLDWEMAERYVRADAERYENQADQWYFWCVRVGRGDVNAARQLAETAIWQKMVPPYEYDQLWSRALGEYFSGDLKKMLATLTDPADARNHDVYTLLMASLLADRLGDTASRDSYYTQIEVRFDPTYPLPSLVNLFRGALNDPAAIRWNRRAFDDLVAVASNDDVAYFYYCAGTFLETHGEHDLGREYLECAATTTNTSKWGCLLASHDLRQRNVNFGATRSHSRPDSWFPAFKQLARAYREQRQEKYDRARASFDEAIRSNPEFTTAYINRGQLSEFQGDYAAALEDYEAVLKYDPECEKAHFRLAVLKSACDKEEFRDGAGALKHAEIAFEGRVTKTFDNYSVLAVAHAESGHFDKAMELQTEAIKLAPKNEELKRVRKLYQEGKPVRYPPKTGAQEEP